MGVESGSSGSGVISTPHCPTDYTYDMSACMCLADNHCDMVCDSGEDFDPRYICKCVPQATVASLYQHNLDENCNPVCGSTGCGGSGASINIGVGIDGTVTVNSG